MTQKTGNSTKELLNSVESLLKAGIRNWRGYKIYFALILCLFLFVPIQQSSDQKFSDLFTDDYVLAALALVFSLILYLVVTIILNVPRLQISSGGLHYIGLWHHDLIPWQNITDFVAYNGVGRAVGFGKIEILYTSAPSADSRMSQKSSSKLSFPLSGSYPQQCKEALDKYKRLLCEL